MSVEQLTTADFREGDPVIVPLDELAWALSRMTPDAIERLLVFLEDLTKRTPLRNPTWDAHRLAIEALCSDLSRTLHE